jgi:hypothetical protein
MRLYYVRVVYVNRVYRWYSWIMLVNVLKQFFVYFLFIKVISCLELKKKNFRVRRLILPWINITRCLLVVHGKLFLQSLKSFTFWELWIFNAVLTKCAGIRVNTVCVRCVLLRNWHKEWRRLVQSWRIITEWSFVGILNTRSQHTCLKAYRLQ